MTRDQILTAAASIFSEKGFHATSMQEIANSVDLQKASLYHHVSSKQEILLALLDQALDLLIDQISQVVAQPIPPDEKLSTAIEVYLKTLLSQRGLAAVLLFEHRSLSVELQSRHLPRRDRFEQLWREIIKEGVAIGVFDCEDPSQSVRALLGAMNWTLTWYRTNRRLTPLEISELTSNLFLHGILTR
jgi:AcrR family transcriptional regulator